MNKRGQGFASGCTLLNVFFVLYATFFFYSVTVGEDGRVGAGSANGCNYAGGRPSD